MLEKFNECQVQLTDSEDIQKKKKVERGAAYQKYGSIFYTIPRVYQITLAALPQGGVMKVLGKAVGNPPEWKTVVHEGDIFDAIHECHLLAGHMKRDPTHGNVRQKYVNITRGLIELYLRSCPICQAEQPIVKKPVGAVKPIASSSFRDRFQVDLKDMQSQPCKDVYGHVMKWIMTLKDHFTKLVYIKALPQKRMMFVASELNHIFGLIGFPTVFHTDNGQEVSGVDCIQMIRSWNPNCVTVTGRPRTPTDQGSVENMNKQIGKVLTRLQQEKSNQGLDTNWVNLLPDVMAAINSSSTCGSLCQSPYYHVFGMEFTEPLMRLPTQTLRDTTTVDEMNHLLASPIFNKKMVAAKCLDPADEDAKAAAYLNTQGVVAGGKSVQPPLMKTSPATQAPVAVDIADPVTMKTEVDQDQVHQAPEAPQVANAKALVQRKRVTITMARAMAFAEKRKRPQSDEEFKFVHPSLTCLQCKEYNAGIDCQLLTVSEDEYYMLNKRTQRWWDSDMIRTWSILIAHTTHCSEICLIQSTCCGPVDPKPTSLQLSPSVKRVVTVAYSNSHYASLEWHLSERLVYVYDGLSCPLETWKITLDFVFARCGIDDTGWKIKLYPDRITQLDDYNCGPIACYTLWSLFDSQVSINTAGHNAFFHREMVIDELCRLLEKYEPLLAFKRKEDVINLLD